MKQAHRSAHRLIWAILAPLFAGMILLSLVVRPAAPVNGTLPDIDVTERD